MTPLDTTILAIAAVIGVLLAADLIAEALNARRWTRFLRRKHTHRPRHG